MGPQVLDEVIALIEITKSTSTWRDAHRKIRARLEAPSPAPTKLRKAAAAEVMLKGYFDTKQAKPLDTKKLKALSFYTKLLGQSRSHNSNLVRPAFEM